MEHEKQTIETSLLVITKDKKLIRINCPFTTMAIKDIQMLKAGHKYKVISIKTSNECRLLYVMPEGTYPHSHFYIILPNKQ